MIDVAHFQVGWVDCSRFLLVRNALPSSLVSNPFESTFASLTCHRGHHVQPPERGAPQQRVLQTVGPDALGRERDRRAGPQSGAAAATAAKRRAEAQEENQEEEVRDFLGGLVLIDTL